MLYREIFMTENTNLRSNFKLGAPSSIQTLKGRDSTNIQIFDCNVD